MIFFANILKSKKLARGNQVVYIGFRTGSGTMKAKVIVIGFGSMGQTRAGSLLKIPDAELSAIVDPVGPKECLKALMTIVRQNSFLRK